MNQDGIWLSILDYATTKKTSISTIRRSIKAGHLKFREENGKYYIWTRRIVPAGIDLSEIDKLIRQNQKLVEEVNDLKMLLSVYENTNNMALPEIPQMDI